MSWLLDTCVLSELVKPNPDDGLIEWINACDESRMYLSTLTLGELAKGIACRSTGAKRKRLQAWLDNDLARRFSGRILPIDLSIAVCWGELQAKAEQAGRPIPVVDGLIAATAIFHVLTVVTRNGNDMAPSGVSIHDPWGK